MSDVQLTRLREALAAFESDADLTFRTVTALVAYDAKAADLFLTLLEQVKAAVNAPPSEPKPAGGEEQ